MGWLIALGIILLLAIVPLGAEVCYDEAGAGLRLIIGPFSLRLIPSKKKAAKKPKKEKPKKEKSKPPAEKKPKEKSSLGGTVQKFWPFVQMGLDFLGDLRRKLRVNVLEMRITMAGDDPCDLAVNYGRAWAAVAGAEPMLSRLFVIKKKDIRVACDFEAESTLIYLRMMVTITLGRIMQLLVRYGIRAVKQLLAMKKQRKKVESV